jgi:hypothetical protein
MIINGDNEKWCDIWAPVKSDIYVRLRISRN